MRNDEPIFWTPNTYLNKDIPQFAIEAYTEALPYIVDFLTAPHPYRKGPVCPFVPTALKKQTIHFTFFNSIENDYGVSFIKKCIAYSLKSNLDKNTFGSIIILFPKDFNISDLLIIHIRNKEQCVTQSLMLGALYNNSPAESLHSRDYFPLRTQNPTLVIRDLSISDLIFLSPDHYSIKKRIVFLNSFIKRFDNDNSSNNERIQVAEAKKIKSKYDKRIIYIKCIITFMCVCTAIITIGIV